MSPAPAVDTRTRVLAAFERHRARPGTHFDESRFLDFLLAKPLQRRAVHGTFEGKRRLHAFLDEVQMDFGICFGTGDRDADPALPDFLARVEALQASRRSSLASLRHQQSLGFSWGPAVVLNFVAAMGALVAYRAAWPLAALVVAGMAVADAAMASWWRRRTRYLRELAARMQRA